MQIRESEEDIRLQMAGERRPREGLAERYFATEEGKKSVRIHGSREGYPAEVAFDAALDAKHILVIGGTGAGKTYFVTRLCERLNTFIFVNTQEETEVENICQVVTSEPDDIMELLSEGYTKIEFIPSEDLDEAMQQLSDIRLILFNLGGALYPRKSPEEPTINFIIDEAQLYAPKMSRTDLDNIGTRGRRWGVRGIFLTQRPQLLSSTLINLCEQQIIFRTGQYEGKYFSGYKIPIEGQCICLKCGKVIRTGKCGIGKCPFCGSPEHTFKDFDSWLDRQYHFLLWDGHEMQECLPVE